LYTPVSSSQRGAPQENLKNVKKLFFVFANEVIYAKTGTYFEAGAE
jgi:hypothetical protein